MNTFHVVAFVDHQSAQVLLLDCEDAMEHQVHEDLQFTRQQGSRAHTEHEFFGQFCDALDGTAEVPVAGGHTGLADFRHDVEKHRLLTSKRIVGYEVVGHPTEKQQVLMARKHFVKYDQCVGTPAPR